MVVALSNQDCQHQREHQEGRSEVGRPLLEHTGGLRPEHLVGHPATEGGTKPLLLRTLHQHHQDEQETHHHVDNEQKANGNIECASQNHGRGTMGVPPRLVKQVPTRSLMITQHIELKLHKGNSEENRDQVIDLHRGYPGPLFPEDHQFKSTLQPIGSSGKPSSPSFERRGNSFTVQNSPHTSGQNQVE